MLIEAVRVHGSGCWENIASFVPRRSAGQCNARYLHYLQPNINLGPFTPEEDILIMDGFLKMGPQWAKIAQSLANRTGHAVKNRWQALSYKLFNNKPKKAPKPSSIRNAPIWPAPPAPLNLNDCGFVMPTISRGSSSSDDTTTELASPASSYNLDACIETSFLSADGARSDLYTFDFSAACPFIDLNVL